MLCSCRPRFFSLIAFLVVFVIQFVFAVDDDVGEVKGIPVC